MANEYYSGQGRVYSAERDATTGAPLGFDELGNIPDLSVSVAVTKFEHKESQSGSRAVDLTIVQEKKGSFSMTLESMSLDNLALAFWGSHAHTVAGSVATENVIAYLGKRSALSLPAVSSVVVQDDADTITYEFGTSATDVLSLNGYVDEDAGSIHVFTDADQTTKGATVNIVDLEVLHIAFDNAASGQVEAFQETSMERYLRFEGLNTIEGKAVIVELYKAQLDPLADYGLINEELGTLTITGSLLYDDKQAEGSNFFRQVNVE
jgi:hypothetical protein